MKRRSAITRRRRLDRFGQLEDRRLLAADIAAGSFTADGTNLQLQYTIAGGSAAPFAITLFA